MSIDVESNLLIKSESPHGHIIFGNSDLLQIIARLGNVGFVVYNFHSVISFVKSSNIGVGNEIVKYKYIYFFQYLIHQ